MARESTITLPLMSRPAPPSAHAWYRRINRADGAWSASAMFSSMAALAIRFARVEPLGSTRGEGVHSGTSLDGASDDILKANFKVNTQMEDEVD